ncbi:MAG TPA: leucyl/phenylalanyl-tRNA--protein transferase [Caulobacteraceae bacterium]|nr:leucyl/phenylalanyl-tRNA--protein transferase [Caulobacteraceae bacterium]
MRDEGVFTVEDLLACYRMGVFPMGEARDDPRVFLVDPKRRGIIEPGAFHLSHRLARTVRADVYEVRVDTDFDQVVEACAEPGPGRDDTWINAPIQILYGALFRRGQAHSVEAWKDGALVGGLYGVSLGGAFFGESMFSTARDASKVALVHLIARLRAGGYRLLDCQFMTQHLAQFGAQEIPRTEYHMRLDGALAVQAHWRALPLGASGAQALQAISQAS